MIKVKDVITIKIPFPEIDSELASKAHMYTCIDLDHEIELLKCQSHKPSYLISGFPMKHYVVEDVNPLRNPFRSKTIIDCDKSFILDGVVISNSLLASRGICQELFKALLSKIEHPDFTKKYINEGDLIRINPSIGLDY